MLNAIVRDSPSAVDCARTHNHKPKEDAGESTPASDAAVVAIGRHLQVLVAVVVGYIGMILLETMWRAAKKLKMMARALGYIAFTCENCTRLYNDNVTSYCTTSILQTIVQSHTGLAGGVWAGLLPLKLKAAPKVHGCCIEVAL